MKNNYIIPVKSYLNANKDKWIIYKENQNKSGIYRWNDLINNKSYIGSSINLSRRLRTYYSFIAMNKKLLRGSSMIYSAILKYDYFNFSLDILEYCDKNILREKEQYYIDLLKPEYNILKTAYSRYGHYLSEKTKKTISIALTGRKHTDETIYKLKERNKVISLKTRLKLSSRSVGVQVEIIDSSTGLRHEFPTMTKTAKYLGVKRDFIGKIFDRGISYKNWIFIFKVQYFRILVYNSNKKRISIFNSIKITSESLNIPITTLRKYIKSGKLYKNKYYFRKIKD